MRNIHLYRVATAKFTGPMAGAADALNIRGDEYGPRTISKEMADTIRKIDEGADFFEGFNKAYNHVLRAGGDADGMDYGTSALDGEIELEAEGYFGERMPLEDTTRWVTVNDTKTEVNGRRVYVVRVFSL